MWLLATVSYPLAGIAGRAVAGPATAWTSALLAGAIAGRVVGVGQAIVMSPRRPDVRWAIAMAAGSGAGLGVSVGLGLTPLSTGLVTGALIGVAQATVLALAAGDARRSVLAWPVVVAVAWALGWTVTTAIGVDPNAGWAVFGLSGALTSQVVTLAGAFALVGRSAKVPA